MSLWNGIKARVRDGVETVFPAQSAPVAAPVASTAAAEAKAEGFPGASGSSLWGGVRYVNISGLNGLEGTAPGSRLNWSLLAGDPWRNSAVSLAIGWAARNFPQAPPVVRPMESEEPIAGHALTKLIYRPNPYYAGRTLWAATLLSYIADGNAYWWKVRDGAGTVIELWYLPHFQITPRFLKGRMVFEQWDGREKKIIEARDIVHFRNGLDPDNTLKGLSPLKNLLREVATDNECTVYDATLLRNMGVPGVIISAKDGYNIDEPGAESIKQKYSERFTGDNRFKPTVIPGGIEVNAPGFSPEDMALDRIRRVPEARIAGAIGIPAMVLGLSVGEDQRSYANMREAREAAAEEFLIPTYAAISDDVDLQLLGVYDPARREHIPEMGNPLTERFGFNINELRMLSDDVNETAKRAGGLFKDGVATRGEARDMAGLEDRGEEDDIFFGEGAETETADEESGNDENSNAQNGDDSNLPES